jgi:hypothetical protein
MAMPEERRRGIDRRAVVVAPAIESARLSWGGVWSGFLIGLGVLMLLSALGLAVGITTADLGTGEGAGARGLGIGAGVWAMLSLLVALFIGGTVAARAGLVRYQSAALLHGALVWVLAMLGIVYLAASGISLGAGALFDVAGGVARGAGSAVASGAGSLADLSSGDVQQILARLGDPRTVSTVAGLTGMSQDEARAALGDIRQRVEAARNDPARAAIAAREGVQQLVARAGDRAQAAARAAQPYAATTSWVALGAMVLSLAAALAGAGWGGRVTATRITGVGGEAGYPIR